MSYVGRLNFPTRYIFLSRQWDVLHLCLNPSTSKCLNVQTLVPHLQSGISLFFDYPSVALTMSLEVIFSRSQTPSLSISRLSHPDSRSDPNGESEPGSGRENLYTGTLCLPFSDIGGPKSYNIIKISYTK